MISRFNRVWKAPIPQSCPIKIEYELVTKIRPISFNEDKSVNEYTEEDIWVERKSKWLDYLKSFDIGSPSEQVINHISKGTPLITAHTLPYGDYTNLNKGAEIVAEMRKKGITLEMIESALQAEKDNSSKKVDSSSGEVVPDSDKKVGDK